ncbi:uncharacterized protein MONBRDRAFT_22586 [Monosiga brevicollis MX1]|uniref:Uncharacterized protein n=1 Tax=Monosiga brevicollis TaxID=81824 RepID=A9UR12_MONBE|nr:uncharacterized protein MONBRDRAFT_22586 [Monosiga brevicollis MX1]EDQ93137.1 predicted protein [Monosiga brevicollis MX1]|eukprot:XP_001742899.1 hypothetical protein [Monosiga brevicollis MX1]
MLDVRDKANSSSLALSLSLSLSLSLCSVARSALCGSTAAGAASRRRGERRASGSELIWPDCLRAPGAYFAFAASVIWDEQQEPCHHKAGWPGERRFNARLGVSRACAMEVDPVSLCEIPTAEKRRDNNGRNKHYVYEVVVTHASGLVVRVWRRYSQFDALRETLLNLMANPEAIPRLTRKIYLKRSGVHEVALYRQPKLKAFLDTLVRLALDDRQIATTLKFFITPTGADQQRAVLAANPEDVLVFPDEVSLGLSNSSNGGTVTLRPKRASHPSASSTPSQQSPLARVVADYVAQEQDEMTVRVDDIIEVLVQYEDGWAEVRYQNREGLLGRDYFELIDEAHEGPARASMLELAGPKAPKPKNPLEELLMTERDFVAMLASVRDDFFVRLRAVVTLPEAKTFFGNWAELHPLHEPLLADLEGAAPAELDGILARHLGGFGGCYGRYCAGLPAAQALYQDKLEDRAFVQFEAKMPQLNKPTLNYFMRPFQRVLKYPLLIKELGKSLDLSLEAAARAAEELALSANESMNTGGASAERPNISTPDKASFTRVVSIPNAGDTDSPATGHSGPQLPASPASNVNKHAASIASALGAKFAPGIAPPAQSRVPPTKKPPVQTSTPALRPPSAGKPPGASAQPRPPPPSSTPAPPASGGNRVRPPPPETSPSPPTPSSGFVMPALRKVGRDLTSDHASTAQTKSETPSSAPVRPALQPPSANKPQTNQAPRTKPQLPNKPAGLAVRVGLKPAPPAKPTGGLRTFLRSLASSCYFRSTWLTFFFLSLSLFLLFIDPAVT